MAALQVSSSFKVGNRPVQDHDGVVPNGPS
jgi:hypothetical protein